MSLHAVYPVPNEAAADWLVAHDRGLSPVEQHQFETWLAEAPGHVAAWARAQAIWGDFDLEPDDLLASMRRAARAVRPALWRTFPAQLAAMAATVLLCVGLAGWHFGASGGRVRGSAAAIVPYRSAGIPIEVALADGSHVTLDARSQMTVRLAPGRRDIALRDGQAFFKVAHDNLRPFVVTAAGRRVTATGTSFSVSLPGGAVSVVLEEGRVDIANAGGGGAVTHLLAGQKFQASPSEAGVVTQTDVDAELAWRDGFIELHDATIADAIAQMKRYSDSDVRIGDKAAGAIRVSGRFRIDDPVRFARRLAEIYPIRVRRTARGGFEIVCAR